MVVQIQLVCSKAGNTSTRIYPAVEVVAATEKEAVEQVRRRYKHNGYTSVRVQRVEVVSGYDRDLLRDAARKAYDLYLEQDNMGIGLAIHIATCRVYGQGRHDFLDFRKAVAREFRFMFERNL
jgi:hypothetical protein